MISLVEPLQARSVLRFEGIIESLHESVIDMTYLRTPAPLILLCSRLAFDNPLDPSADDAPHAPCSGLSRL